MSAGNSAIFSYAGCSANANRFSRSSRYLVSCVERSKTASCCADRASATALVSSSSTVDISRYIFMVYPDTEVSIWL